MFNKFRLKFDGSLKDPFFVLNSAIEHIELNEYFVNTGRYLVGEAYPYLMDCGVLVGTLLGQTSWSNKVIHMQLTAPIGDNLVLMLRRKLLH